MCDMYEAVLTKENNLYAYYEGRSHSRINRICIDGRVTGCGKCVGYCQYEGHAGYLTEKLRKKHECLEKGCFYYVPKPARKKNSIKKDGLENSLLSSAIQQTLQMEGLRIMSVQEHDENHWQLNYVTISDGYPLQDVILSLEEVFHRKISFKKLDYSFDRCAQLILAD